METSKHKLLIRTYDNNNNKELFIILSVIRIIIIINTNKLLRNK